MHSKAIIAVFRLCRARSCVLLVLCFFSSLPYPASAQIQIGTVRVKVIDPTTAVVEASSVTLANKLTGYHLKLTTNERGVCEFNNVPFDAYTIEVFATRFEHTVRAITVKSNVPVDVEISLSLTGAREIVEVEAGGGLIEIDSSSTRNSVGETSIRSAPGVVRNVQQMIATMPGWTTENNGLLHIRGVDDGILYVLDGVPLPDRLDQTFSSGLDSETISSINVLTGNIPAEFGGRSGAVVTVQPRSGIATRLNGTFELSGGSFDAGEIAASAGGGNGRAGFFVAGSGRHSDRFLDPVDPNNFNNRGGAASVGLRTDWHWSPNNILILNAFVNGSDFHVPNHESQQAAGQRQRQEVRDNSFTISWQRTWSASTVSNVALFNRFAEGKLIGSAFDTPLFASQDRQHWRTGVLASLTHVTHGHTLKAGGEAARVAPDEFFTFAITDPGAAEAEGISDTALEFTPENPFVFRDRKTRGQASAYVQDSFSPFANLSVNAGLRFDHSSLLVSEHQFSPRVGAVYYIPKTHTAVRGSFNRLFMPPQVENLLLSDSEQTRALSPFETSTGGGAHVRPEKTSAYEVGFAQDFRGLVKLDAVYWYRTFRNYADPNAFFSTTVIFPNSVAKGYARGVDVRLDVPERHGWSGFASYTNQRILQTGPINGGLFLTDEVIEIGPGTKFIPDHDERNSLAFSIMYRHSRSGFWASVFGRHESGVPLEVDEDSLDDLKQAPGADLVDFDRQRVKPWTVIGLAAGAEVVRRERVQVGVQFDVQNVGNKRFAYNFGNPFEGTHFGYPRLWSGRLRLSFR